MKWAWRWQWKHSPLVTCPTLTFQQWGQTFSWHQGFKQWGDGHLGHLFPHWWKLNEDSGVTLTIVMRRKFQQAECWWVLGYVATYIFRDMLESFCAAQSFMCVSVCTRRSLFLSVLNVSYLRTQCLKRCQWVHVVSEFLFHDWEINVH